MLVLFESGLDTREVLRTFEQTTLARMTPGTSSERTDGQVVGIGDRPCLKSPCADFARGYLVHSDIPLTLERKRTGDGLL